MRQQRPEAQLLLVGRQGPGYGVEPPQGESHLMDALDGIDCGGISVLDWLPHPQMLQLLRCSACHLALSYPYTLSWSVLEAMACGAPLISNIGSPIAADLQHDRDALLVPFNDVNALAQAVLALLKQPQRAQQLGDQARKTMQRSFNLAACAKAYEELFSSLIGPPKALKAKASGDEVATRRASFTRKLYILGEASLFTSPWQAPLGWCWQRSGHSRLRSRNVVISSPKTAAQQLKFKKRSLTSTSLLAVKLFL